LGAVAAVCIENAVNRARLLRAGITDFLTGWHNRRYLQQRLKEELARAQRRSGSIACLMIDIDRFKSINDGYGHLAGDLALKEIAQRVESQIRSMDTAARFGGDELAILLPDASAGEAAKLAERIRESIAATPFTLTQQIERTLTVSVGVAAVSPTRHESDLKAVADRLIADADAALYRAKALGRNRVQLGSG
jgi:diguanylate cyclase (GGDEF)-like protein